MIIVARVFLVEFNSLGVSLKSILSHNFKYILNKHMSLEEVTEF